MAIVTDSHLQRALRVTPGASQTRSKAPGQVGPRFGPGDATDFPLFALKAEGAYLWDERGRKYLDCFGANAAIPLGAGYPAVVSAVFDAAREGSLLSLPHVSEADISELFLSQCAPWAEQVRWLRTGSEAVSAAVRLARILTGRSRVVAFDSSYHGWHDVSYARFRDEHKFGWSVYENGVPAVLGATISLLPYGSEDYERQIGPDTAALLVEANRFERTDVTWLHELCAYAKSEGTVVIFDEMVYGLRWANGGASEYFGVTPDLACFGKALGNGVPVACVCGPERIMSAAELYVSGTYGGDRLGLAAAGAVLRTYRERDIIKQLWALGGLFWQGFTNTAPAETTLGGYAVHWRLQMPSDVALDQALLYAARNGILFHRSSNNASAAMTPEEASRAGEIVGYAAAWGMEMTCG